LNSELKGKQTKRLNASPFRTSSIQH
jgi:hypothetical protein